MVAARDAVGSAKLVTGVATSEDVFVFELGYVAQLVDSRWPTQGSGIVNAVMRRKARGTLYEVPPSLILANPREP